MSTRRVPMPPKMQSLAPPMLPTSIRCKGAMQGGIPKPVHRYHCPAINAQAGIPTSSRVRQVMCGEMHLTGVLVATIDKQNKKRCRIPKSCEGLITQTQWVTPSG